MLFKDNDLSAWKDGPKGRVYSGHEFIFCNFSECLPPAGKSVRPVVSQCTFKDCGAGDLDVDPLLFEDILFDNFGGSDLVIFWAPIFHRVRLKGQIGSIKINTRYTTVKHSAAIQKKFDAAREKAYADMDWALDISEARLSTFDLEGIPARLIKRNPAVHLTVTRKKAKKAGWRKHMKPEDDYWVFRIDNMLDSDDDDVVIALHRRKTAAQKAKLRDGMQRLRDLGVAEPD